MRITVNFRSFIVSMLILMGSVLCCLLALNIPWLGFLLLSIIVAAPAAIAFIIKKKVPLHKFVTLIMASALCVVSAVIFFVTVNAWIPNEIENKEYTVKGLIEDNYVADYRRVVVLKDLQLDGEAVGGKMKVTVDDKQKVFTLVPVGDTLEFTAKVTVSELVSGFTVNASALRNNIRYYARTSTGEVKIAKGEMSVLDKVNVFVKNRLTECMGNTYGVVAYGILTGDKNEISASVRESFSAAGIAHILAVSGLHIGFLMLLITFLLSKLKTPRLINFGINFIVLLMYCLFAGFTPSVVRASIMFLIGNLATLLGEERDGFNALGLAATAILTFIPIMLFDAGFIMSVGAVFGIFNFAPIIADTLTKIKIPSKIASAVSVSAAAQLGILPACIIFFGNLQLYSVLINVLLMPLMSILFIAIFVALVISLIPIFKFLLTVSGFLVKGMIIVAEFCATLPFAQIAITSTRAVYAFYPLYFVSGGFLGSNKKRLLSIISWALIAVIILILLIV
ncbi:MAG: ComEC/Rec2 family competence protein [Clostridiales bacterium]|nr:ComEC/Rec2 family competence protein [Clostridiales bacterium]